MQKDLVTRRFHTTFIIIQYILESPNVRQQGIWLNFIKVDTMDTMQSLNTLLKLHFYCYGRRVMIKSEKSKLQNRVI